MSFKGISNEKCGVENQLGFNVLEMYPHENLKITVILKITSYAFWVLDWSYLKKKVHSLYRKWVRAQSSLDLDGELAQTVFYQLFNIYVVLS